MKIILAILISMATVTALGSDSMDDRLRVLRAGCDASSSWIPNRIPDKNASPENIGRCYSYGVTLLQLDVEAPILIREMCSSVIFSWPRENGAWKQACEIAAYKELNELQAIHARDASEAKK